MFYKSKLYKSVEVVIFLTFFGFVCAENADIGFRLLEGSENVSHIKIEESEFPEDLFTEEQRKHGAIVLHIILAIYCFGAIATVCTEYFLPTIACICKDLKLSDDVAAATFMSIATSSPELFTNIIGTFITESDIGVGHVLGNAYYDMFFVVFVGGLVAKQNIVLDWWPITRDCFTYLIVAITLTAVVWDGQVDTFENIILLSLYVLHFIIMFNNRRIIQFCKSRFNAQMSDPIGDAETRMVETQTIRIKTEKEKIAEEEGNAEETMPLENDVVLPSIQVITEPRDNCCERYWNLFLKWAGYPLTLLTRLTIPDVRKSKLRKYYPVAFLLCVAWIGVSTYLCTWMISVIGETIGVPDSIMGMVFMAAGGSVVEVYAVFFKSRRGECSIGLSNSMGCNTIDATMCLALPWLIKTLIPLANAACYTTTPVLLQSSVLHVNCVLLIISVLILYAILFANKFRLNKILGFIAGFVYVAILIIAITLESYSQ